MAQRLERKSGRRGASVWGRQSYKQGGRVGGGGAVGMGWAGVKTASPSPLLD